MMKTGDAPQVPSAEFLAPEHVCVTDGKGAGLAVQIEEERWPEVQVRRVFPLNPTDRMIVFLTPDEQYIGTLEDYHQLKPDSRGLVQRELEQQYFRPVILQVNGLRKRFGMIEMDVTTEAGARLIRFRSPRDDIRELGPGRFLLTDATGNRYELPCLEALDDKSRKFWGNLV